MMYVFAFLLFLCFPLPYPLLLLYPAAINPLKQEAINSLKTACESFFKSTVVACDNSTGPMQKSAMIDNQVNGDLQEVKPVKKEFTLRQRLVLWC